MKTIHFMFNRNELGSLGNAVNEVCNGILINEFTKTLSVSEDVAENILKKITLYFKKFNSQECSEHISVDLERFEVVFIIKAIKEVYKEIDDWEFGIRLGIEIPEMQAIEQKLRAALESSAESP